MKTASQLPPAPAGSMDDSAPERTRMQRLGHPAVDALRRTVHAALADLIGNFLRFLPVTLTQRAKASSLPSEQRGCAELARLTGGTAAERWLQEFTTRFDAHLIATVAAGDRQPLEADANDVIVLTQRELRAQTQYAALIADLDVRLGQIRRTTHFPVRAGALAPAALCRTLLDAATAQKCSGAPLRILFEQFDESVLPQLPRLYQVVLDALADIEARAAEASALLEREKARAETLRQLQPGAAETPAPAPAAKPGAPPPPPQIDSKTASMLKGVAMQPPPPDKDYSDVSLAQDLLTLQTDAPLAGVDIKPEQRWVPLQRISLAGKFLNEAIADPLVPKDQEKQHEAVRFPVIKSAITDATLFTAVTHPLRALVNDLMLKSATSRITGTAEARRMAEVLQQVLVQFDLAPDFVREAMLTAQPIQEEQIQSFFESQKEQTVQRREAVVAEAKRLVVRELELRTFGRSVPAPAIKFLNTCWGPLLVKGLLQHGADSAHWRAGIDRMESMLDQLEISDQQMPPPAEWQETAAAMGKDLREGGLSEDRVKRALALLDAAWQAPKQQFSL
ncbi:DUF1631 family protein [Fontimonas sp. SYSU GA230001]|uniref:DUF1631 family protein n=1 Tax=Fontimonas sp. SYSU GA230001 TaxID=3142450 RepID=UPI0032B37E89